MTEPADRDLQAAIEYAKLVNAANLQHMQFLKDYGSQVLRTLMLLNGGAVVAILAMIGSLVSKTGVMLLHPGTVVPALAVYVLGLICAVVSMAMGYFNFQWNAHVHASPSQLANRILQNDGEWPSDYSADKARIINWTANFAIFSVIFSMIFFVIGSILMACVFYNFGGVAGHDTPPLFSTLPRTMDWMVWVSIAAGVLAAGLGLVAATVKIRDNIDKFISDLHRQGTWASWAAICAALAILLQALHYLIAR